MKNFYIVNWKETTLNKDNFFDVESGTCDEGFNTKEEAMDLVKTLVDEKYEECVSEGGYDIEDVLSDIGYEYGCVNAGSNTYEFSVYGIFVK